MTPAVRVRGLRKTYADVVAVDNIDLTVEFGECFAILGPNGAGKTTAVEIMEGYRDRDGGEVEVLGVDPAHADRAWRAQVGIVLQSVRDLSDVTVHEAVRHFAAYYPNAADIDQTIAAVGLQAKEKARIGNLSGGQRRRLDVALGIIGTPRLLFLDEPTTGFDPEARREFWALLQSIQQTGTTIVLTTHYLEEAEALADRVAVVAAGRVVAVDTPTQLGRSDAAQAEVSWWEEGHRQSHTTAEPADFIVELHRRLHGEVVDLAVRRSTLEDRYLALIDQARSQETS